MPRAATAFPPKNPYKSVTNRIQTEKSATWRVCRLGWRRFQGESPAMGWLFARHLRPFVLLAGAVVVLVTLLL
jgi:hypothetical protein